MEFKDLGSSGDGGGSFIRLKKDGESVKGVFQGNPYDYKQHWGDNKKTICIGMGCALCRAGDTPRFRFRINFIIKENGAYTAKIWEQGITAYKDLSGLNKTLQEEGYKLDEYLVKITRSGLGKEDTSYPIIAVPGGALDAVRVSEIKKVKLLPLNGDQKPAQDQGFDQGAPMPDDSETPF